MRRAARPPLPGASEWILLQGGIPVRAYTSKYPIPPSSCHSPDQSTECDKSAGKQRASFEREESGALQYLARYTHRVAISNGRLIEMRNAQVTFRWRDSADGNQQKLTTLDAVDFIHRFLLHVLPSGFVKIRHFGFLANRNRRQALQLCHSFFPVAPDLVSTLFTETQRRAIERKCPYCHTGTLHIVDRMPAQELAVLQLLIRADTS